MYSSVVGGICNNSGGSLLQRGPAYTEMALFAQGPPIYGGTERFQSDPHWKDLVLFFEYFHGDTGAGLGASHQTGWTSLVASLIDEWRR